MRLAFRIILPLLAVLSIIAWAATPLVGVLMERWFRSDVENRSRLVFDSIQNTVASLTTARERQRIDNLFDQIAKDERLLALGRCTADGRLAEHSSAWPRLLGCPSVTAADRSFAVEQVDGGPVLVATFPLDPATAAATAALGRLVIIHDLRFIKQRSNRAEGYLAAILALLGLAAAGVTVVVARLTLRGWVRQVCQGLAA